MIQKNLLLIVAILAISPFCRSQMRVKTMKSDPPNSGYTLYLYSDSTFFYEWGETYGEPQFVTGKFQYKKQDLVIIPDSAFTLAFNITTPELDSCSRDIDVKVVARDQKKFDTEWTISKRGSVSSGILLMNGDKREKIKVIDHISKNGVLGVDKTQKTWGLFKINCDGHELVLTDFSRLGEIAYAFPISAATRAVVVEVNLPHEVVCHNMLGIISYGSIKEGVIWFDHKKVQVRNRH